MIRRPTNDLSIKPKMSSNIIMVSVVLGLLVLFCGLYFTYNQGVEKGHSRFESDQQIIDQLNAELAQIKLDLTKAQESLTFAQRQQQIQEEAYKQITKAYANSEQKNAVLGSRLDFYRSIISPESGQRGPAIQDVKFNFSQGELNFDVTLVQAIKHSHQVRGNLIVTLYENDSATGRWPANSPRSVSYQYFQQVSGSIPKGDLTENAKLKVEFEVQEGETLVQWVNVAQLSNSEAS